MPVVESLMAALRARYGHDEGERAYYAMEASGKGPFAKGAKYAKLHEEWAERNGVAPANEKPPASRKRGARKRRR